MGMPGFGDGGSMNTWIIINTLFLIGMLATFQKLSDRLDLIDEVAKCDDWWAITNAVLMVVIAIITTVVNQTQGARVGEDILEHYKIHHYDTTLKEVLTGTCNNTGLVGALLFSSVVKMVISTPTQGSTCSFAAQL